MSQSDIEKMVKVLKKSLPDARIILFGSRARGTELKDSLLYT